MLISRLPNKLYTVSERTNRCRGDRPSETTAELEEKPLDKSQQNYELPR